MRWFKLASEINPLLRFFRLNDIGIPTIYIMGDQDHLFLPNVKKVVDKHELSSLHVIEDCGHVVNVQKPLVFNTESLAFINSLKS